MVLDRGQTLQSLGELPKLKSVHPTPTGKDPLGTGSWRTESAARAPRAEESQVRGSGRLGSSWLGDPGAQGEQVPAAKGDGVLGKRVTAHTASVSKATPLPGSPRRGQVRKAPTKSWPEQSPEHTCQHPPAPG